MKLIVKDDLKEWLQNTFSSFKQYIEDCSLLCEYQNTLSLVNGNLPSVKNNR